ncbi:MAG: S1 family peptidase [Silicimonas sp.]|nr:S1 family peptidase [Silicimonas sp.]
MILRLVFLMVMALPLRAEPGLEAAGRLEIVGRGGTCSGVLVAPDLIATAAHCITGTDQVFRVGDGLSGAIFLVERLAKHPLYEQSGARAEWKYRFDIALGQLARPVPGARATPLPLGDEARPGETLLLVSWKRDGTDRPRLRDCAVVEGASGLVTLGCKVEGGESGAPVLRRTATGFELVAIISSRLQRNGRHLAQASDVRLRLPPLFDELRARP